MSSTTIRRLDELEDWREDVDHTLDRIDREIASIKGAVRIAAGIGAGAGAIIVGVATQAVAHALGLG